LAFAVGVVAVPIAQAKPTAAPATQSYTKQQLQALELRSEGMNARYVTTATSVTPQQVADELRFQGVDKEHGLIGRTTTSTAPAVVASSGTSASSSFDWGDAFVGAAAIFATAIVLAASFTAIKRREQPLGV
jgi:hypothetical protein